MRTPLKIVYLREGQSVLLFESEAKARSVSVFCRLGGTPCYRVRLYGCRHSIEATYTEISRSFWVLLTGGPHRNFCRSFGITADHCSRDPL